MVGGVFLEILVLCEWSRTTSGIGRDFLLLWWLDTSKWDETLRISYLNNLMLVGIVGVMNY